MVAVTERGQVAPYAMPLEPLVLPTEPASKGELVVIGEPGVSHTQQRFDATFAARAKVERAVADTQLAREKAARGVRRDSKRSLTLGVGAGVATTALLVGAATAVCALAGMFETTSAWALLGLVPPSAGMGLVAGYNVRERYERAVPAASIAQGPITSSEIAPTVALLQGLSVADRAALRPHIERYALNLVHDGKLTPTANQALLDASVVDPSYTGTDQEIGRIVELIASRKKGDEIKLIFELSKVLNTLPQPRRRELAEAILGYFFKDEVCIDPIFSAYSANVLHEHMTEAQRST